MTRSAPIASSAGSHLVGLVAYARSEGLGVQLMVSGTGRRTIAAAGLLAAIAGGAVIARADDPPARGAQAAGGLGVSPMQVERPAAAGAANVMTVANHSRSALDVTVKARPWIQSSSGATSPNRRRSLGGVRVSEQAFTLAPGASKLVTVTLGGMPSGGALFGALEIVGLPQDLEDRKGIVAGYRLVSALRYTAATPRSGVRAGAVKLVGTGSKKTLTLTVRNTGNTIEPVSGRVRLKGPLGTKNASIKATRILPGKSVRLGLFSGRSLRAGTYTATIRLTQAGETTSLTKKVTVRR
jgi:hypothetical protein